MNFGQAYYYGIQVLKAADDTDAETDAFYLLEYVTGLSKSDYLLKKSEEISGALFADYEKFINRRAEHEPCQYIIGKTEFMGLPFYVSPAVLIPRQDTETLVETVLDVIKSEKTSAGIEAGCSKEPALRGNLSVLDMCTGSGAIAVSIYALGIAKQKAEPDLSAASGDITADALGIAKQKAKPGISVTAVDISADALDIAKKNAELNEADIEFIRSDMFGSLNGRKFDVIVSNPPYVTEEEYEQLMPEVRLHEPEGALLAGADGLDFYRIIAKQAGTFMNPGGYLFLEIGCEQAEQVSRLLEDNRFGKIRVVKDLNGKDRVVSAILMPST